MTGQVWPARHRLTRLSSANPLSSVLRERGDGRQGLALKPFEEGAASSRNIGEVFAYARGIECRHGIPAAGDGHELALPHKAGGLTHQFICTIAEGLELEGADRAVPHQRLHLGKPALE